MICASEVERDGHDTVLVVDDDPVQRGEIVEYLAREGISVISEDNGFAAVHRLRHSGARVVVMDIRMPGLDGIRVSRLMNNLHVPPKVILVSGYPDCVHQVHKDDVEIFAVIEKPVPLKTLALFVTRALNDDAE